MSDTSAVDLESEVDPLHDAQAEPFRRLTRWRVMVVSIVVACAALPLLRPSGPGNTGAVDLALICAILVSLYFASSRSFRLKMPYAFPAALMVVAGSIAALTSHGGPGATSRSALALVQDVFVFGWAAAIATVGQDKRLLNVILKAISYSTVAWAGLLIFGELAGLTFITGINSRDGVRASLTFGDPNLAADFFICGLLVLRAAQLPRRRGWRFFCCTLIVVAIILTLSNGGMLALLIATFLGAMFSLVRRRGVLAALTVTLLLGVAVVVATQTIDIKGWVTNVEQSDAFIRDSLGRQAESSGSRSALAHEELTLWFHDDAILGYGPANTESTLQSTGATYVKEAHDDYLASVLERGILGATALVLLMIAVGVRARRISLTGGLSPEMLELVPRPEILAAACIAIAFSAAFYETLHFRHVWAVFGIIAAIEQSRRTTNGNA